MSRKRTTGGPIAQISLPTTIEKEDAPEDVNVPGYLWYIIQDANYNVVGLTNNCNAADDVPFGLIRQFRYMPYGDFEHDPDGTITGIEDGNGNDLPTTGDGSSLEIFHGLHGLWREPATGHYLPRHRYYIPSLGRYGQTDPNETGLIFNPGLAMNGQLPDAYAPVSPAAQYNDGPSLYQFVASNPNTRHDPSGLSLLGAYDSIHNWYGQLGAARRAIRHAGDVQDLLWSMDWGEDDYGDAIYGILADRDFALDTLTYATEKTARGRSKSNLYRCAALDWTLEWASMMAPDIHAALALPFIVPHLGRMTALANPLRASRRAGSGDFIPASQLRHARRVDPNGLGPAGEAAAGITRNTKRIDSYTGAKTYRIPDGLNKRQIIEVKNVARLSLTNQLRDSLYFAMVERKEFILYIRATTRVSRPLGRLIERGYITVRYLP